MVIWRPRSRKPLRCRWDGLSKSKISTRSRNSARNSFFTIFANFSQFVVGNNNFISDVQFKYILALVNMAATVSYSCDNAESRFKVCPSPIPVSTQNPGHIESILSQVQIKYSPLESPPVRIWSTIWTEVNQGSSDRAEKGSEAQTGNEKLLQPRFFQGHFLKLKISPIQPNYKLLYKFLNYEQFMTWWVLSVWELYYYS